MRDEQKTDRCSGRPNGGPDTTGSECRSSYTSETLGGSRVLVTITRPYCASYLPQCARDVHCVSLHPHSTPSTPPSPPPISGGSRKARGIADTIRFVRPMSENWRDPHIEFDGTYQHPSSSLLPHHTYHITSTSYQRTPSVTSHLTRHISTHPFYHFTSTTSHLTHYVTYHISTHPPYITPTTYQRPLYTSYLPHHTYHTLQYILQHTTLSHSTL